MFVQVISGQVSDPPQVRRVLKQWMTQLAPGAIGWLGTTAGVTEDGRVIALARFASQADAQRNSDRPEQGQWWSEMERLFTGEVTFRNSTEVDVDLVGDPGQAGFVQIMQGRVTDADRARELMRRNPEQWAELRPDILGTMTVVHEGGEFTIAAYFTSEAEARTGEATEPTPEMVADMEQLQALTEGELEYLNLKNPWLDAP